MDGPRFDTFTWLIVADVSRRGLIRGALAALAGTLISSARATSGRAQGAELGCCRCTGTGSPPGCQAARDLGDCRQLCGRSTANFDAIATCDETSGTCRAQVAAADEHGCCFCLKEPGRSRGCVNAKDLEECKVHCKQDPTNSDEPLPADADVDFNTNKICQPSEAGGKKYVCRTKAMSTAATEDALQYDPVAFAGGVAVALAEFESTPLAFVYDPEHEDAVTAFYGAAPPAGWQGMLRSVLYVPDPNGPSGQGISQALYLKGHWFDSDANAREWYAAGKPLIEASGNGRYVDQTGEADFGIQRTLWGTSFPTADNPDVTINRGIAWFRRGHVVIEATLDAYCASGTATTDHAVQAAKVAVPPFGAFCADGVVPYIEDELGALLDDNLSAAETASTVTRHLPVIPDTPVVQVVLTQWGDQVLNEFGATEDQRERREAFNFGAEGHLSGQYAGVDADGNPVAVFTNTWFVELYHEGQIILMDDLVEFVAASDQQNGFERAEIPSLTLSGEGWAITANAFVFTLEDDTTLGGVEVRGARDTVVATAAVVTPRPPGTTPQDVRSDFERRAAEAVCDPSAPPDANADVEAQVFFVAMFLNLQFESVVSALAGGGFVDVMPASEAAPEGEERPPAVGSFMEKSTGRSCANGDAPSGVRHRGGSPEPDARRRSRTVVRFLQVSTAVGAPAGADRAWPGPNQ